MHDYIDLKKLFKDELRKSHAYKEMIEDLEAKVHGLEAKIVSLREKMENT